MGRTQIQMYIENAIVHKRAEWGVDLTRYSSKGIELVRKSGMIISIYQSFITGDYNVTLIGEDRSRLEEKRGLKWIELPQEVDGMLLRQSVRRMAIGARGTKAQLALIREHRMKK